MTETALSAAVDRLVRVTAGWTEADLERPWAWREYDEGTRVAFLRTAEELRELAADIADARASQGPRTTFAQRALAQYQRAYRDFGATLLGVSDVAASQAPSETDWPIQRAVTHVVSTERHFFARMRDALLRRRAGDESPPELSSEEVDAFLGDDLKVSRIRALPLSALLATYDHLHQRVLAELADVSDAELATPVHWWEDWPYPVRFRLFRFDSHLRQHQIHVEKLRIALKLAPTEVERLARLVYDALGEVEGALIGAPTAGSVERENVAAAIRARADELAELPR